MNYINILLEVGDAPGDGPVALSSSFFSPGGFESPPGGSVESKVLFIYYSMKCNLLEEDEGAAALSLSSSPGLESPPGGSV